MTIDVAGVVELLERAVGGDDRERLDRACARYCAGPAGLAGVFAQSAPIGVVATSITPTVGGRFARHWRWMGASTRRNTTA